MPGNRDGRWDEDEDLEGAGILERGQPISRLFETLEYRVTDPEGDLPEVPGRRPNGGVSGACANTPSMQRSRGCREADAEGRSVRAATEQAKTGKGKAPGREKPRRARRAKACRNAESSSQRDRGIKSLQRGRAGPTVRNAAVSTIGPSTIRFVGTSARRTDDNPQCTEAERSRRQAGAGETETARRPCRLEDDTASPIAGGEVAPEGGSDPCRVKL